MAAALIAAEACSEDGQRGEADRDDTAGPSCELATGEGGGGGELGNICQPTCSVPADCCPGPDSLPPDVSCPEDFPFNFVCPDGVCRPGGCASDADCEYFGEPAQVCMPINGVALCRVACASDDDCPHAGPGHFPSACARVSDEGCRYCAGIDLTSLDCADDDECMGLGVCMDGACGCEDATQCSDGWGCTPAW